MKKWVRLLLIIIAINGCSKPSPTDPAPEPTATPIPTATPTPRLDITFVNVGQGDAEYIVLPNGKSALIDGGPNQSDISAFLTQKQISTIDYVVLTHPHSDHLTGLKWVFDNLQVNSFYDTRVNNSGITGDEDLRAKAAAEPNCSIYYPSAGETLNWDASVSIRVLNGQASNVSTDVSETINNASVVLQMTFNGKAILLAGDIQNTTENLLITNYGASLDSYILKVAHHGSSYGTSDVFLNLVTPQIAFIEVGGNSYGHPATDTLNRLTAHGVTVYRADVNGTMSFQVQ